MADPTLSDGAIEAGKVAGGGGIGFILAKLADRFFKKSDDIDKAEAEALKQVLAKLDIVQTAVTSLGQQTQASISLLGQQLAVLTEGTRRRDEDVSQLERTVEKQGQLLARLEAKLEEIAR